MFEEFKDFEYFCYLPCAKILLIKLEKKERLNKNDFHILKLILKHYIKRGN